MCTTISAKARIAGSARSAAGWTTVDEARVGYDHPAHAWSEHALLIDLVRTGAPAGERIAIELDLESGRALAARLAEVIAAAERSGVAE